MGLDDLRNSVLESAQKEAARILAHAQEAAKHSLDQHRAALDSEYERRFSTASRAVDEEFARKLTATRRVHAKELLEKRNERLREVFHAAREIVLAWPVDAYRAVMAKQLEQAAEQGGKLRVHPSDAAVFKDILEALNSPRAAENQVHLDESSSLPQRGGFIFVGDAFEIDRTLDTALAELERDLAPSIAAALFGKR